MTRWEPVLTDLVRERGGALVRYATSLCGDGREAEDLVQDALVRVVVRHRAAGNDPAGPVAIDHAEAYVRRAVLNLYLDDYRRRRRWTAVRHLLVDDASAVGPDDLSPEHLDLDLALSSLPPRQRTCIVLRYFADLTVDEIAADLGVTAGTVKRHLHDAGLHLNASLAPAAGEETS